MNWSKKYQTEQWYKKQEENNKKLEEEMVEKIKADKEFIQNLPPEKQTEYKLFKIFFTIFMIGFFLAANFGYRHGFLIKVLFPEAVITLVSLILWKIKPKKIKFPSVCMMPVIAFALTLLGQGGLILGDVLQDVLQGKYLTKVEEPKDVENDSEKLSDYELWLQENDVIQGDVNELR